MRNGISAQKQELLYFLFAANNIIINGVLGFGVVGVLWNLVGVHLWGFWTNCERLAEFQILAKCVSGPIGLYIKILTMTKI